MWQIARWVWRRSLSTVHFATGKLCPGKEVSPNLTGDRDIEWSWVLSHLNSGPGKVLDLGPGPFSLLSLTTAQRGYEVVALDLRPLEWPVIMPGVSITRGDILREPLPCNTFDVIINCSTIEHVGLVGRYDGATEAPDGDLEAMNRLYGAIKPTGIMLLTIPIGTDGIFSPLHRVYGEFRLPLLLQGWTIKEETYWAKTDSIHWEIVGREKALAQPGSEHYYCIGGLVLQKGGPL